MSPGQLARASEGPRGGGHGGHEGGKQRSPALARVMRALVKLPGTLGLRIEKDY